MSLIEIIRENDFEKVVQMINEGEDINQVDEKGQGVLHIASNSEDQIKILDFLIMKGADVNLEDQIGATPLHRAAFRGNLEGLLALLNAGAEEKSNSRNQTPSILAGKFRKMDCLDALSDPKSFSRKNITDLSAYGGTPTPSKPSPEVIQDMVSSTNQISATTNVQQQELTTTTSTNIEQIKQTEPTELPQLITQMSMPLLQQVQTTETISEPNVQQQQVSGILQQQQQLQFPTFLNQPQTNLRFKRVENNTLNYFPLDLSRLNEKPLNKWDMRDVAHWLISLDLREYVPMFVRNHIKGSMLPLLTESQYIELGVKSIGARNLLQDRIALLKVNSEKINHEKSPRIKHLIVSYKRKTFKLNLYVFTYEALITLISKKLNIESEKIKSISFKKFSIVDDQDVENIEEGSTINIEIST